MDWDMNAAVAAAGWQPGDELLRVGMPTVARGNNLVAVVPPSPAWAMPILAALVERAVSSQVPVLVLVAPAMVDAVGQTAGRIAAGSGARVVTANGASRAARVLRDGTAALLVTSPATALALHTRSQLPIDHFGAVALGWPEHWAADEAMTVLLGEFPRDAQRVVLTSSVEATAELVERHLRRAVSVAAAGLTIDENTPAPKSVRTITTPWSGRVAVLRSVVESLDPAAVSVWTADPADHAAIDLALIECADREIISRGVPSGTGLLICYDLPSAIDLTAIGAGRDVVLLVPPGTTTYVTGITGSTRPVRTTGAVDLLRDRDAQLRGDILARIEAGDLSAAAYLIGPLLDAHDPQAVAAACAALWREAVAEQAAAAAPEPRQTPVGGMNTVRIWIGAGRKDEATPADIVALLIKEIGLTREAVGRIELKDTFSLVEVPAGDAERIAQALTGRTIRKRRLIAKVDRGPVGGDRGRGPTGGDRGRGPAGGDRRGGSMPPRGPRR